MVRITRKKCLYAAGICTVGLLAMVLAAGAYFKSQFFQETPNTLSLDGIPNPISFQWSVSKYETHTEHHDAILIPVALPGVETSLFMQFDTGSANTILRSGALDELAERGIDVNLRRSGDRTVVESFEFLLGGATVQLRNGHVIKRGSKIVWDDPDARNIIGSIGTDLLDGRVCVVDFPSQQFRLYANRPEELRDRDGFVAFEFPGRRIVLPVQIGGENHRVLWDSGCSSFGLLTSGYYYRSFSSANDPETTYNANRHGEPVPVHHRDSDLGVKFGTCEVPLRRVSYVNLYETAQTVFGRFSGLVGFIGFLGNKPMLNGQLVIDCKSNEYLLMAGSEAPPVDD